MVKRNVIQTYNVIQMHSLIKRCRHEFVYVGGNWKACKKCPLFVEV